MRSSQKLHQAHLQEWTTRFADQKASGLSVQQWCDLNQISIHTYKYWKRQLRDEVVDAVLPDIVPITIPAPAEEHNKPPQSLTSCAIRANCSTAKLSIGDISIEVDSSISEDFLRTLIKAVRYA